MTEETAKETAKQPRDMQNGVTRPKDGTKTGKVWAIADGLMTHDEEGYEVKPARKDVIEAAVADGINSATAATQYANWCTYHGFSKSAGESVKKEAEPETAADLESEGAEIDAE
jgi:hypothetical protein